MLPATKGIPTERRSAHTVRRGTGGWGYDHFDGDSQTSVAAVEVRTACFTCHSKRQDHDFVYSTFRR